MQDESPGRIVVRHLRRCLGASGSPSCARLSAWHWLFSSQNNMSALPNARNLIPDAILDQLLAGADPKTAFDPNGLLDDLKKALAERVLKYTLKLNVLGRVDGYRKI
jgi:hypothetical protein